MISAIKKIPLLKSNHVNNSDVVEAIIRNNIDWLFIIGWSQIASKEILNSPNKGVLGMHPSLLPEDEDVHLYLGQY